jgi:hypothetical protein
MPFDRHLSIIDNGLTEDVAQFMIHRDAVTRCPLSHPTQCVFIDVKDNDWGHLSHIFLELIAIASYSIFPSGRNTIRANDMGEH